MSTNFIHRVVNQSNQPVQLIYIEKHEQLSYDLVLGPGQSVSYRDIYGGGSAPVPGSSALGFQDSHIRLQVGDLLSALYDVSGMVRHSPGEHFKEDAPPIGGFAGPGPLELTINAEGKVVGKALDFFTGPRLAAVNWATARYGLYGINETDGTPVEKSFLTSHWGPWTTVGRPEAGLRGPLAAVSWAAWRYSVYALGRDGLMYEKAWLTDRWEEWMQHSLPAGVKLVDLSAVQWETGRYGIYAVSADGGLYEKWWGLNKWHGWNEMGRPDPVTLVGPIASVSWSAYRYGIYALGSDGQVWQKWYGAGWSGWDSIGAPNTRLKSLCAAAWGDREYVVAGVGEDGNLWRREYKRGWRDWKNLGTPGQDITLVGPAAAVSWRLGQVAFYAKASNGLVYQRWGDSWTVLDGQ